jgi:hypothetical protein
MKDDSKSSSGVRSKDIDGYQKAIDNLRQWSGIDCMALPRSHVLKLFERTEHIDAQIEEAFAFEMFVPDLPPQGPINRERYTAYLRAHMQKTELLGKAIELWLLTFGVSSRASSKQPDQRGPFSVTPEAKDRGA